MEKLRRRALDAGDAQAAAEAIEKESLVFGDGRLIVKPFGEGCVGIVCVPRINVALVNLTANVTVRKIHDALKERAAASEPAAPAAVSPTVAPPPAEAAAPVALTPRSPREAAALAILRRMGKTSEADFHSRMKKLLAARRHHLQFGKYFNLLSFSMPSGIFFSQRSNHRNS